MKFLSFILLLGVCSFHGRTAAPLGAGNYIWSTDNGTLRGVSANANINHIDLSDRKIKNIAERALDSLKNRRTLHLSNNELEDLPLSILLKITHLEELSLVNNKIASVDEIFIGLSQLKRLGAYNSMKIIRRGDLFGLTKSIEINIKGNGFGTLSSGDFQDPSFSVLEFEDQHNIIKSSYLDGIAAPYVEQLPNDFGVKICKTEDGLVKSVEKIRRNASLGHCMKATIIHEKRKLDLRRLGLKEFQLGWYKLSGNSVKELDLSHNLITDITSELFNHLASGVSSIDLRYNKITIIRRNIIANRYFRELYVGYNPLSAIEDGAFEKTNLTLFSAGSAKLTNLSFVRTLPTTIEEFLVSLNPISEIPANTFQGLRNLKTIDLSWTRLKNIKPGTFEDLKNLVKLRLGNSWIRDLNSGIFRGLMMIEELSLTDNDIKKISRDTFSELRGLNGLRLYLSDNRIDVIEEGSFSDMNITRLDLSWNRITDQSIARGAFNRCTLNDLDLSNNLITKIKGESFDGILGSYQLFLSRNKITTIEKGAIQYMKNLRCLHLNNNPLERLENGALYGPSKDKDVRIHFEGSQIKSIPGGLFDNV